jgi:carboxymethylenebutenolidase
VRTSLRIPERLNPVELQKRARNHKETSLVSIAAKSKAPAHIQSLVNAIRPATDEESSSQYERLHYVLTLSDCDASKEQRLKTEKIMVKPEETDANTDLTPAQETLRQLWEEHVRYEFSTRNTEETLATMVEDAYVNHIPVLTGGVGRDELREFYSKRFIPQMPPDTEMTPVSRTIGEDQLVDEMVFKFTHSIRMDWMLPGVAPTGKRVEIPLVAIVRFRDGKLAHEHIYWDQASVLVQIGLIDAAKLPVAGVESARKVLDPALPANALLHRADRSQ